MTFDFDAYVISALFDGERCAWALGDGTVRWSSGEVVEAHDGAALCAAAHPRGGVLTGGDDGRLVRSTPTGAKTLATLPGRWIDAVKASPASGLIAFAAGKDVHVRDAADAKFERVFSHPHAVADLVWDAKGRRLACATYGGAATWLARIAGQKPTWLKHPGSHTAIAWSPDDRFLMTAMQDNQLHGWRLSDGKSLRMGGYPAKVKSLAFVAKGLMLATSGSQGAVLWPFAGANGPMGKSATEVGADPSTRVTIVAGVEDAAWLAVGTADGRVWRAELTSQKRFEVKAKKGPAITALALSPTLDRLAWGDEDGGAGLVEL